MERRRDRAGHGGKQRSDAPGSVGKEQETQSVPLRGQANDDNSPNDTDRTPTPPPKQ